MTTVQVKWLEERLFQGIGSNGNSALMSPNDGPGVSPMQMLLLGMGGCTAYDVVDILQKQRQPLAGLDLAITGERGEEQPKPWTQIHVLYRFRGDDLDPVKVERAIALSVEKYCGALATIAGVATVTHDYEILPAGEPVAVPA
jgi:putative redox protein